jgi:hypothetical protein
MAGESVLERKDGKRREEEDVKAARGGRVFIMALEQNGMAPNPIGGARPQGVVQRYKFYRGTMPRAWVGH